MLGFWQCSSHGPGPKVQSVPEVFKHGALNDGDALFVRSIEASEGMVFKDDDEIQFVVTYESLWGFLNEVVPYSSRFWP